MFISFRPLRHIADRAPQRLVRSTCVFVVVLLVVSPVAAQSTQPAKRPSFDAVTKSLTDYFASLKDYKAGDLVSQSVVDGALNAVANKTGWKVTNQKEIVGRALADNSFLVTELATPAGRPFMRNLAKYAGSYPRLDRLSTISGGQQFIKDMTTRKDGYIMIEYLATTQGGRELGTMMSGVQKGVDLNKPTGRIYTADDLLAALKQSYGKSSP